LLAVTISKAGARWLREEPAPGSPDTAAAGGSALAIADIELDKILSLDPNHLPTLMTRMMQSLEQGRVQEAQSNLQLVLSHVHLRDHLSTSPDVFTFLHQATERFAQHGLIADALKLGEKTASLSFQLGQPRGRSHFYLAKVHSIAARTDPLELAEAAKQLQFAVLASPRFKEWYRADREFDPVRIRLDAALDQLPEPIHDR
jgi:hypothetical protein